MRRENQAGHSPAALAPVNPILFDLAALEASATRTDAGPDAVVSRAFIRDVLHAVRNPALIRLLHSGQTATPLVIA